MKTGRCERRWVGTPGRRCRCSGRRRRFAPPPASAAATAARRAHPPSLTATSFHKISFYQPKKQFISQNEFISQRKPLYPYNKSIYCHFLSNYKFPHVMRVLYGPFFTLASKSNYNHSCRSFRYSAIDLHQLVAFSPNIDVLPKKPSSQQLTFTNSQHLVPTPPAYSKINYYSSQF